MFEQISKLIEDSEKRKIFSNNAMLDVDKFSKDEIIKVWLKLVEDL